MSSHMFGGWAENARQPLENARQAIGEASEAARRGYDEAAHQAHEAYSHMDDVLSPYRRSLEDAIVTNPVKAVAVSLAVGVFLGWLIKRS